MYNPEYVKSLELMLKFCEKYKDYIESAHMEAREHTDAQGDVFQVSPKLDIYMRR